MDKTKIFHIITSLNIGGTEKFLLTVLRNLNGKYDFSVGYLKERGQTADEIDKLGIPVKKFNFFSLANFLKKNKPQIIHTHLYRANIIGRIAGKISGTPTIISSQRSIDGWKNKKLYFIYVLMDNLTSHFCNKIIANSEYAKHVLQTREKIYRTEIDVIQNYSPIVLPSLETLSENNLNHIFKVGFVMRLHKEKGAYLIPEIIKNVMEKNKNIRFSIYGNGPEYNNIQKEIDKYNLTKNIIFFGWQNNIEDIYNNIDLLILPSEEESFPQAALESMSYGVPVIASDVGGVSELVEHQKTGLLIKNRTPEEFAKAILSVVENKYDYILYSENSKIKASGFSMEKMINSVDNIYKSFIKK